jgi:hypothetical protein
VMLQSPWAANHPSSVRTGEKKVVKEKSPFGRRRVSLVSRRFALRAGPAAHARHCLPPEFLLVADLCALQWDNAALTRR